MIGYAVMWVFVGLGAGLAVVGAAVVHSGAIAVAGVGLILLGCVFAYWEDRIQKRGK